MEHQKILNLLNDANNSKFLTRKCNIVNDNSKANYEERNKIIYNTKVLKFTFYDYNDSFILLGGDITIIGHQLTQIAFKNCALFTKYIAKIDGTIIDDAENLDLLMPLYNLIK